MDLNKLYYFYIVAKHEHVTRAAEELCVSQPALTKTVKGLEEELGVPLFKKQKRNIVLTEFGRHLKDRLTGVFAVLDEIPGELEELAGEVDNTIRLNVLAASTIVTEAVIGYKKQNEKAIFQVIQNEEEADCDISISTDGANTVKMPDFEKRYDITEKIYLAVPKEWKYAKDEMNLADFKTEGFVNLAGSRLFRVICDRLCLLAGFEPKIVFESDSIIAVKNIIGSGAGVGFWPEFSWGEAAAEIKLLEMQNPSCCRVLTVGLHKEGGIAQEFYEYLVEFMDKKKKS